MYLYHGSNVEVISPKIIVSNRNLDFGVGFYTTSNLEQAKRWAYLQTIRRKKGTSIVTYYGFDENDTKALRILRFDSPNKEWLNFVADNRKGIYSGKKYDIVIGPVANDNTMPVINDYMSGNISEEIALVLLMPQKLSDQYAFLTERSLELLNVRGISNE